jgi:hypothetical protein
MERHFRHPQHLPPAVRRTPGALPDNPVEIDVEALERGAGAGAGPGADDDVAMLIGR